MAQNSCYLASEHQNAIDQAILSTHIDYRQRKSHVTFDLIHKSVHGLVFECAIVMASALVSDHLINAFSLCMFGIVCYAIQERIRKQKVGKLQTVLTAKISAATSVSPKSEVIFLACSNLTSTPHCLSVRSDDNDSKNCRHSRTLSRRACFMAYFDTFVSSRRERADRSFD